MDEPSTEQRQKKSWKGKDHTSNMTLRLPRTLFERIDQIAAKENRTRTNMINCLLQRAVTVAEQEPETGSEQE